MNNNKYTIHLTKRATDQIELQIRLFLSNNSLIWNRISINNGQSHIHAILKAEFSARARIRTRELQRHKHSTEQSSHLRHDSAKLSRPFLFPNTQEYPRSIPEIQP